MSHIVAKSAYKSLEERINRLPLGAPPSKTLYQILGLLFSEKEASLVAQLPIKPFTVKKASQIWHVPYGEALKILDTLAGRCILLDMEVSGEKRYLLPPPMAGFLEFSLMRVRNDVDQKVLSELFHQYLNVEEDFVKELFFGTETKLGRTFVNESVLSTEQTVQILDFEKASHVIETASHIGISMCYCRHKAAHLNENCDAPMDICMTFNGTADSLIRHSYARSVEVSECLELLHQAYESNLVQCGENSRNSVAFICNCCGCCCEALVAAKKFGNLHPVETTNYLPKINEDACINCGKCEKICPIDAISQNDAGEKPLINEGVCLGCGLCVRSCPKKAMFLEQRATKIITPANSVHRIVVQAIEKGMLQELIFDNKALLSHRAMAAILSAILKLSPIHKIMASQQMKSVYLEKLLNK